MALRDSSAAGCPAPADAQTAELTFDGTAYIANVCCVGGDCLEVAVEQKDDASTWRAAFAAKYVEEITAKTGSFKRFPVFVKMLLSALRQESDSVFVDLLTYADLELLRSKRSSSSNGSGSEKVGNSSGSAVAALATGQQKQPQGQIPPASNKRYLILTYAAEFDRVHYPLPLQYEEHPDPQRLKATIRQLRAQLDSSGSRSACGLGRRGLTTLPAPPTAELKQLREENAALREQLQQREAAQGLGSGVSSASLAADVQQLTADVQVTVRDLRAMRRERDGLLARLQQAQAALEAERNLRRRELRLRGKDVADLGAELAAAKDQIRELRLKCRELTQELDLSQRRGKVASMSATLSRQPATIGRPLGCGGGAGNARGVMPAYSRGTSPAGRRYHSRDTSPAPIRRAPLPGPPRSRSADVSRSGSQPSSRPTSAGRFDPSEYIRQKRERERDGARRLEEMRQAARMQSQGSRGGSLHGSRPPSVPSSRHSTPHRSRVPSRDPSADRAQAAAHHQSRSAERSRLRQDDPRARDAAGRSTERLRAALHTTISGRSSFPAKEQRSASPGRALLEVRQRLQQYANKGCEGGIGRGAHTAPASPGAGQQAAMAALQQRQQHKGQQLWLPPSGDHYADASAEIADIDSRLQSLQTFLKAAKTGQPAAMPA